MTMRVNSQGFKIIFEKCLEILVKVFACYSYLSKFTNGAGYSKYFEGMMDW